MKTAFLSLVVITLLAPFGSLAREATRVDAAFLFAYQPKKGHEAAFDTGYREHLDWHRRHEDPLPWYGWYVSSGDRTGLFVDGSFGIDFAAFDSRVKPAEDAADSRRTIAPHGDTAYRKVLRLMPHLGTVTPLEDREPAPSIEVVTYFVMPGRTRVFESCLERLSAALGKDVAFTVYRQLSGGTQPAYLVMFPRDGYAYFNAATPSLDALIETHVAAEIAPELHALLFESVRTVHSETWRYREDLSYFPAD